MWSSALLILSTRCHSTERQSSVLTIRMYNRSEEHTSELQSPYDFVCRLLLEKKTGAKNTTGKAPEKKRQRSLLGFAVFIRDNHHITNTSATKTIGSLSLHVDL